MAWVKGTWTPKQPENWLWPGSTAPWPVLIFGHALVVPAQPVRQQPSVALSSGVAIVHDDKDYYSPGLIVPPVPRLIPGRVFLRGVNLPSSIVVPNGRLIIPAQRVTGNPPSLLKSIVPTTAITESTTFWIERHWVADFWITLPPLGEMLPPRQLIVPGQQRSQTLAPSLQAPTLLPLANPIAQLLVVPPQPARITTQSTLGAAFQAAPVAVPNTPITPLIVPAEPQRSTPPATIQSLVPPRVEFPVPGNRVVVLGQPTPPVPQHLLVGFIPRWIGELQSQPLIVPPTRQEQSPSFTKSPTHLPIPTFPTVGSQLIAYAQRSAPTPPAYTFFGGELLLIPPVVTLSLSLIVNDQIASLFTPEERSSNLQIANYGDASLAIANEADSILNVENL